MDALLMCACDEGPRMCPEHRAEADEHERQERTEDIERQWDVFFAEVEANRHEWARG